MIGPAVRFTVADDRPWINLGTLPDRSALKAEELRQTTDA
jgi:hypothetical protein